MPKISDADEITNPDNSMHIPVVKDSENKKITHSNLNKNNIQKDVSGQYATVEEKTSGHSNDLLLIEDSQDSNKKKRIKKSNFLSNYAQVITGVGAPADTPAVIGIIYVDTSAGDVYISKGTSSSSDFVKTN